MRSQPLSRAASRRRAEEQFKTKKKVDPADPPAPQQAEVEKTARLRALPLAKEAADKETANRDAAAATAARSAPLRHVSRGPQAARRSEPK
jgi:hypothetical protein